MARDADRAPVHPTPPPSDEPGWESPLAIALGRGGPIRAPLAEAVRAYLLTLPLDHTYIRTSVLVDAILPNGTRRQRQRVAQTLNRYRSLDYADCCSEGSPRQYYNKAVVPLLWHRPDPNATARAKAAARFTPAHAQRLATGALAIIAEIAAVPLPGEPGFAATIDEQLGQLEQMVHDARALLEG